MRLIKVQERAILQGELLKIQQKSQLLEPILTFACQNVLEVCLFDDFLTWIFKIFRQSSVKKRFFRPEKYIMLLFLGLLACGKKSPEVAKPEQVEDLGSGAISGTVVFEGVEFIYRKITRKGRSQSQGCSS